MRPSKIVSSFILLFPWFIRRRLYVMLYDYKIHPSAYIGFSIVAPRSLFIGEGAYIGHMNIIINLDKVECGEYSIIARGNWITGAPHGIENFSYKKDRKSTFFLGRHAAITKSHIVDCTDSVCIGEYSTIAGYSSQFITHGINVERSRQECGPIEIGAYCMIGSAVRLVPNSKVPSYCVLGAGSVVTKIFAEEYCLYAGVPATKVKKLESSYGYFCRSNGFVN